MIAENGIRKERQVIMMQVKTKLLNWKVAFKGSDILAIAKEQGWDDAVECGAIWVQIYASDLNKTFTATIQKIWQDGFAVQRAGFEKQIALPIHKFAETAEKTEQLKLFDEG